MYQEILQYQTLQLPDARRSNQESSVLKTPTISNILSSPLNSKFSTISHQKTFNSPASNSSVVSSPLDNRRAQTPRKLGAGTNSALGIAFPFSEMLSSPPNSPKRSQPILSADKMADGTKEISSLDANKNSSAIQDKSQKDFTFKAPLPVFKDTPRTNQPYTRSFVDTQYKKPFAPATPSPLNSASVHLQDDMNLVWTKSKKAIQRKKIEGELENSPILKESNIANGSLTETKSEFKSSPILKPLKKDSERKRERDLEATPLRRKKSAKSRISKKSEKTPGSVRKSSVPVKSRVQNIEKGFTEDVNEKKEIAVDSNSSKRKFEEEASEPDAPIYPTDLKPDDGFEWIHSENIRKKRVKLDVDTIVKKRIEYFQKLGLDAPLSESAPKIKEPSSPAIKLREETPVSTGRVPLSSKPKIEDSGKRLLRRELDDDELDELTMKRLKANNIVSDPKKHGKDLEVKDKNSESVSDAISKKPAFSYPNAAAKESTKDNISKSDEKDVKDVAALPLFAPKSSDAAPETSKLFSFAANTKKSVSLVTDTSAKSTEESPKAFTFEKSSNSTASKEQNLFDFKGALTSTTTNLVFNTQSSLKKDENISNTVLEKSEKSVFNISSATTENKGEAKSQDESSSKQNQAKPFSFGKSASTDIKAPSFGLFGASAKSEEPSTKPSESSKAFTFGSAPKESVASDSKPEIKPFTFGAAPSPAITTPSEPSKATESKPFSFEKPATSAETTKGFTFGGSSSTSNTSNVPEAVKPFSFGSAPSSQPASESKPFSFGAKSSSISTPTEVKSFGSSSLGAAASKPAEVKPFAFGAPSLSSTAPDSKSETKPFTFGAPSQAATTSDVKPSENKPFTFGAPSQPAVATDAKANENKPFTFGAAPSSNTATTVADSKPFSFTPAANQASAPTFAPSTNSSFTFGSSTTSATQNTSGAFTFGANNASASGNVFGAATTNASAPTNSGFTSSAPAFGASSNPPQSNVFGSSNTGFGSQNQTSNVSSFGAQSSTTPTFGSQPQNSSTPSFGNPPQSSNAPPAFGAPQNTNAPFGGTSSSSGFGSNNSGFNAPSSTSAFGNNQQSQPFGTSAPAFGGQSQPAPVFGGSSNTGFGSSGSGFPQAAPSTGFGQQPQSFGQSTPAFGSSQPNSTPFSFNAPAVAPPSINFSGTDSSNSSFTFGAASGAPQAPQFNATTPMVPPAGRRIAAPKFRRGKKR